MIGRLHRGNAPLVVSLFHGLGGDADSSYLHRVGLLLHQKLGASILRMNLRGQGEGFGRSRFIYHSGSAPDIYAVIKQAREFFPSAFHVGIGFSLSANMILNLAASEKRDGPDYVIAVNPPTDLEACCASLRRWKNRLYDASFVSKLRKDKAKRELFYKLSPVSIPYGSTLWDFDEIYTAREGGFKNRDHYYRECSSASRLKDILVKTTIIMSQDDPFIPCDSLLGVTLSSQTNVILAKSGGHLGYLEKTGRGYTRWMDNKILELVTAVI